MPTKKAVKKSKKSDVVDAEVISSTPAIVVDLGDHRKSLALAERDISKFPLSLASKEQAVFAVDVLSRVKTVQKEMKAAKKSVGKHLTAAVKALNKLFKPLEETAETDEQRLKDLIVEYQTTQQRLADEAQAKIKRQFAAGKISETTAERRLSTVVEPDNTLRGTSGGSLTLTERRGVEIYNPDEIPDEYWVIDEVKVRKDVLEGTHVPGARVTNDKGAAAR